MRGNRNYYRVIYAALVIIAFFIPAYGSVSAFQFLVLAFRTLGIDNEITLVDLLVVSFPLLLIPISAAFILVKALHKKPLNSFLLGLPFFCMSFFFVIFSFDMNRQTASTNIFDLLAHLHIGFYLAVLASLLLLFTYSRRDYLDFDAGRG